MNWRFKMFYAVLFYSGNRNDVIRFVLCIIFYNSIACLLAAQVETVLLWVVVGKVFQIGKVRVFLRLTRVCYNKKFLNQQGLR